MLLLWVDPEEKISRYELVGDRFGNPPGKSYDIPRE